MIIGYVGFLRDGGAPLFAFADISSNSIFRPLRKTMIHAIINSDSQTVPQYDK